METTKFRFRPMAACAALHVAFWLVPAWAGDLQSDVNEMFNNLGVLGNYTAPGAFKGQTYNTYTGGNLMIRTPNKNYQLVTIEFPYAKAGCGGIDVFGGSFSHLGSAEFKNVLKNITAALPGIAFQLALSSVSPLLAEKVQWAKNLETFINNARINSCETATALVKGAADAVGFDTHATCIRTAILLGIASDEEQAREKCRTDQPSVLAQARASGDPNVKGQVPFVGNVMWEALKRVATIDDAERLTIMSLTGTIVYHNNDSGSGPLPEYFGPTINTLAEFLYGHADAGEGRVQVSVYTCDTAAGCINISRNNTYTLQPFTKQVEDRLQSLAQKIDSRQPPTPSDIGFVNTVSEPVYRMLSVGTAVRGSGLAETLINQYKNIIAIDFAYNYLDRSLRNGLDAITNRLKLDTEQEKQVKELRDHIRAQLFKLTQERQTAYGKIRSFNAVASHLEMLERQQRALMPQHVMDMLSLSNQVARR